MAKFGERLASVFFLGLGAFVLGRKIGQKQSDSMSGIEDAKETPIKNAANKIAKTGTAYIYWDIMKYVYVVEDFCYPDGNGRYLIHTVRQGQKVTNRAIQNAYDNFQKSWGY